MTQDTPSEPPAGPAIDHARQVAESLSLGGDDRTLSLPELASAAGMSVVDTRRVLAAAGRDRRDRYGPRDVAYVRTIQGLSAHYPTDALLRATRVRSRHVQAIVMSDLTLSYENLIKPLRDAGLSEDEITAAALRAAESVLSVADLLRDDYLELLEALVTHEAVARAQQGDGNETDLAVGFVDLVGFTRLSAVANLDGMGEVLRDFEDTVADAVERATDVMISKFIGDAAMVVGPDASQVAGVVHEVVAGPRARRTTAERRGGMAFGRVLAREGDYYGDPVNLAARLTDHARAGTVLVDQSATEILRSDDGWSLTRVGKAQLKGLGEVVSHRLDRAR